jgi:hypothetical protein
MMIGGQWIPFFANIAGTDMLQTGSRADFGNCGSCGGSGNQFSSGTKRLSGHLEHLSVSGYHCRPNGKLIAELDRPDKLGVQIQCDTWKSRGKITEGAKDVVKGSDDESPLHGSQRVQTFFKHRKGYCQGTPGIIFHKFRLHRGETVRWKGYAQGMITRQRLEFFFQKY